MPHISLKILSNRRKYSLFAGLNYNSQLKERKLFKKERNMKYVCQICGYEYDEERGDTDNGIAAGTKWADLPDDWVCPLCGVGKEQFSKVENA